MSEQNAVEHLLRLTEEAPGTYESALYQALLESDVFAISLSEDIPTGQTLLKAGSKIALHAFEHPDGYRQTPFFSSLTALQSYAQTEEVNYIVLPGQSFFEITKGHQLVLNPTFPLSKAFSPEEVETFLTPSTNQTASMQLIPANDVPAEMIHTLRQFLSQEPAVESAYIAGCMDPKHPESKSRLLIGVNMQASLETIVERIRAIVALCAPREIPIDLTQITPNEDEVSVYFFNKLKPFYRRNWWTRLKAWFTQRLD